MKTTEERKLGVFLIYAKAAHNWGGRPAIGLGDEYGTYLTTRQGIGTVTLLKEDGLLTTYCDTNRRTRICFTDEGKALAAKHGVTIEELSDMEAKDKLLPTTDDLQP